MEIMSTKRIRHLPVSQDGKIVGKKDKLKSDDANKVTAQLKAEKVANEAKAAKIAAKTAVVAETKEEETPVNDTPIVDETSNEEKASAIWAFLSILSSFFFIFGIIRLSWCFWRNHALRRVMVIDDKKIIDTNRLATQKI
jgi:hypothetical protein